VTVERPLVGCPACGRLHPGYDNPADRAKPHYCSIACYRTGRGLDDPVGGDGRRWCGRCRRYLTPAETDHSCDADGDAVGQPRQSPPSHRGPRPETPSCHDAVTMTCPVCDARFIPTGRQRYCSDACRSAAYRRRRRARTPSVAMAKAQPRRPITVYECDSCGERAVGEQRCDTCGTFMRKAGLGGCCPSCDDPITVAELVGAGVDTTR
jgi:predicted nucleic acid-binding Zn ribbon protein